MENKHIIHQTPEDIRTEASSIQVALLRRLETISASSGEILTKINDAILKDTSPDLLRDMLASLEYVHTCLTSLKDILKDNAEVKVKGLDKVITELQNNTKAVDQMAEKFKNIEVTVEI